MISPHRLTNLDSCLLNVAYTIIRCLTGHVALSIDNIYYSCKKEIEELDQDGLILAINFLFLLGLVDYHQLNDEIALSIDQQKLPPTEIFLLSISEKEEQLAKVEKNLRTEFIKKILFYLYLNKQFGSKVSREKI